MFPTWLRSIVKLVNKGKATPRRGRNRSARPRNSFRPLFEQFEERLVPTSLSIPTTLVTARSTVITAPVMVTSLNDPGNGNSGICSAPTSWSTMTRTYSPCLRRTCNRNADDEWLHGSGEGYSPTSPNGWNGAGLSVNIPSQGELHVGLSNNGSGIITDTASGSVLTINFHVKANARFGRKPYRFIRRYGSRAARYAHIGSELY